MSAEAFLKVERDFVVMKIGADFLSFSGFL